MARYIDADALKTAMDECIYSDRDRFSTGYAKSFIDDAPTVDAEPVRHGRLLYEGMIENTWRVFTCSVCGCGCIDGGKYCPNCGAKMDGGADDAVD